MIVVSLLLILVAVTLLVFGLAGGASGLLISSIVASLLAAVTLVVGARQAAGRRSRPDSPAVDLGEPEHSFAESDLSGSEGPDAEMSHFAPSGGESVPADGDLEPQFVPPTIDEPPADVAGVVADATDTDDDDEPEPQPVTPGDAVRVARLDAEVLVVDGRPRYHLPDCPHLVGRETEPIAVNEAVELGFSPCGRCRPVDRLVGASAHH